MDHASLDGTKRHYRVGEKRRRGAVDRLTAKQFDRHGNRVWRDAKALLDGEHARRAVGEVVVPFGVCTEPSNVQAGGNACPYRFRCVGCDHFRTDVSYLPDLQAHLDDLLRNRERLRAAVDIDEWTWGEATPSDEEISRIRRLISRVKGDIEQVTAAERARNVRLPSPNVVLGCSLSGSQRDEYRVTRPLRPPAAQVPVRRPCPGEPMSTAAVATCWLSAFAGFGGLCCRTTETDRV